MAGVDAVVHCATSPLLRSHAVDVEATQRLMQASKESGVGHVVYPSIVGINRVPYPYFRHKPAAERAVMDSAVPFSILRATKFHEFLDTLLGGLAECPESPVERCHFCPFRADFQDQ